MGVVNSSDHVVAPMSLFSPFRVVGLYGNDVPVSVSARGTSVLIATSIGRSFHVYDVSTVFDFNFNCCNVLLFTTGWQTTFTIC